MAVFAFTAASGAEQSLHAEGVNLGRIYALDLNFPLDFRCALAAAETLDISTYWSKGRLLKDCGAYPILRDGFMEGLAAGLSWGDLHKSLKIMREGAEALDAARSKFLCDKAVSKFFEPAAHAV